MLFEKAVTISNNRDINKFFNRIVSLDLINNYYLKKPTSNWSLVGLPNVEIYVFPIENVPIGASIMLPPHIKNSKSVIGLTHSYSHHHPYEDNKCFWRCLAIRRGAQPWGLERESDKLKNDFENHTKHSCNNDIIT